MCIRDRLRSPKLGLALYHFWRLLFGHFPKTVVQINEQRPTKSASIPAQMANSLPFGRRPEPCLQLVPPLDTPRRDWPARCQNSPATPCGITLAARIAARPSRHLSYKSALWDHSRHHGLVSTRVPREIMGSAFQRCPRATVSSALMRHEGCAREKAFPISGIPAEPHSELQGEQVVEICTQGR